MMMAVWVRCWTSMTCRARWAGWRRRGRLKGQRRKIVAGGVEDFRWRDLRHTFATWHREAGTPTHELQRLGGWKTQSTVERSAYVAPEGLQLAASRLAAILACTNQV